MKAVEWHVRRLDNGSIDYAFYRAEATRQRTEASEPSTRRSHAA